MTQCVKSEDLSSRMCYVEIEDWYECKSRKKHRAFQNFVQSEMNKMDILSLPTYDHNTDTFKDGSTTMVISPDSDFFEFFESSNGFKE
mgnify:CR=1 FL=1